MFQQTLGERKDVWSQSTATAALHTLAMELPSSTTTQPWQKAAQELIKSMNPLPERDHPADFHPYDFHPCTGAAAMPAGRGQQHLEEQRLPRVLLRQIRKKTEAVGSNPAISGLFFLLPWASWSTALADPLLLHVPKLQPSTEGPVSHGAATCHCAFPAKTPSSTPQWEKKGRARRALSKPTKA